MTDHFKNPALREAAIASGMPDLVDNVPFLVFVVYADSHVNHVCLLSDSRITCKAALPSFSTFAAQALKDTLFATAAEL